MTSLASPCDFRNKRCKLPNEKVEIPELSAEDAKKIGFTNGLIKVERSLCDPIVLDQRYCLVSFLPSQTAKPDQDGIYGMIKVRGCFRTIEHASERAEDIIKTHDSYNKIYTAYVGKPFPATESSAFSKLTSRVDLNEKIKKNDLEHLIRKREQEAADLKDVQARKEKLVEDGRRFDKENKGLVPRQPVDPLDDYIELRVKRAQLKTFIIEYERKIKDIKNQIGDAERKIVAHEKKDPTIRGKHYDKYKKARKSSGLKMDTTRGFLKFLNDDIK